MANPPPSESVRVSLVEGDGWRITVEAGEGPDWGHRTGDVDAASLVRWQRIQSEWQALQQELGAIWDRWSKEDFERRHGHTEPHATVYNDGPVCWCGVNHNEEAEPSG